MIESLRWPSPTLPSRKRPAPSGPRCARLSRILMRRGRSIRRSGSNETMPAIPHMSVLHECAGGGEGRFEREGRRPSDTEGAQKARLVEDREEVRKGAIRVLHGKEQGCDPKWQETPRRDDEGRGGSPIPVALGDPAPGRGDRSLE